MVGYKNKPQENCPVFKPGSTHLMGQIREGLRYHHYSLRTETAYVKCILSLIRFNQERHLETLGKKEIEAFLSDMAINKNYAAVTRRNWCQSINVTKPSVRPLCVAVLKLSNTYLSIMPLKMNHYQLEVSSINIRL